MRPKSKSLRLRLLIPKLLFLPIVAFALMSQSRYVEGGFWDTTLEVVSLILLCAGAIGRVWVSAYISGRKSVELVTDGPYSITRNPLYFFSFVAYLGAGLAFEKLTLAIAFGVFFFASHWSTILAEELKLRGTFGDRFVEYVGLVPRFVPRLRHIDMPEHVRFHSATFNRAILDCALITLVFVLAHLVEYGQNCGIVPVLIRNVS